MVLTRASRKQANPLLTHGRFLDRARIVVHIALSLPLRPLPHDAGASSQWENLWLAGRHLQARQV